MQGPDGDTVVMRVEIDREASQAIIDNIEFERLMAKLSISADSAANEAPSATDPLNSLERTIFRDSLLRVYKRYMPRHPAYGYINEYRADLHARTRLIQDLEKERSPALWYEAVRVSR